MRTTGVRRRCRRVSRRSIAIHRYRPRIEGLFARIERWTNTTDRRHPLALHLQGQHHHVVRQDTESRASPIPPIPTAHLHLADLREPRRQGQRHRLRVQGRRLATDVDLDAGPRAQSRRRTSRAGQSLSEAHQLRQPHAVSRRAHRPARLTLHSSDADWMFEVVFDYGEHYAKLRRTPRTQFAQATSRDRIGRCGRIRSPPTAPASRCAPTASASAC